MSKTAEKYTTTKDESDLEKHIEQACIQESYDRLRLIIEEVAELAKENLSSSSYYFDKYVELEKLSLELARFTLDYLAVQKGIMIKPPKPVTREELEEILKKLPVDKN